MSRETCPICEGTGERPKRDGGVRQCAGCDGRGWVRTLAAKDLIEYEATRMAREVLERIFRARADTE